MLVNNISLDVLARKLNGKVYGSDDFKVDSLTGVFTTLNEAKSGDIVIRHWINSKGVEIANSKNVACIITLHPDDGTLETALTLNYPVIVVEKIELANAFAIKESIKSFAPNSKRVVVTGTNGKSTTTDMIYQIVNNITSKVFTNTDARSEFNTLIDPMVSRLIAKKRNEVGEIDYLVIEVSEVQGWQDYFMRNHASLMSSAIDPDVAIVTNIAMDHIGLVNSIDEVKSEIESYVKSLNHGTVVLNMDDINVYDLKDSVKKGVNTFYLTMDENLASNVDGDVLYYSELKKAIIYKDDVFLNLEDLPFKSHHFIQNTLSAIAASISLNISLSDIKEGVKSYRALKRRFTILKEKPLIIDDFAHNPQGIRATIESAFKIASTNNLNKLYVINAIRGSRGLTLNKLIAESLADTFKKLSSENTLHLELILSCSSDEVDNLNTVLDEEKEIFTKTLDENNIEYTVYDKLISALTNTLDVIGDNDVVLLIGAQGMDPAEDLLRKINFIK